MTAVLEMYFDESMSDKITCVAAYVFEKEKSKMLDGEWKKALADYSISHFHMVDCAHRHGEFANYNKKELEEIQICFFNIIKKYASMGVCITFEDNLSDMIPGSRELNIEKLSPYQFCCWICFAQIRKFIKDRNFTGTIDYFFEDGHANVRGVDKIINAIVSNDFNKNHYRYGSHEFLEKEVSGLQCADILAWQWRKNVKERKIGNMKPRLDLKSLLEIETHTIHFDNEAMVAFFEKYKKSFP